MKWFSRVQPVAAAASAAVFTFVHLGEIPLGARLVIVGLSCVWGFAVAAAYVARWGARKPPAGFGAHKARSFSRRFGFAVLVLLTLGIIATLASTLLWITVIYHNVLVTQVLAHTNPTLSTELVGPHTAAANVTVTLPAEAPRACSLYDPTPAHRSRTIQLGWATANPSLEIAGFKYPERQGIACSSPLPRTRVTIRIQPATVYDLWPEDLSFYRIIAICYGGAIWFIGVLYVWVVRSRR